jgi:hypothetical protein
MLFPQNDVLVSNVQKTMGIIPWLTREMKRVCLQGLDNSSSKNQPT